MILAGIDPEEFGITVFCNLPGTYEPRPWVKVVRLDGPTAIALSILIGTLSYRFVELPFGRFRRAGAEAPTASRPSLAGGTLSCR